MKISKEDLMAIKKTGESIFLNEVQSYYLLGNTNEYDKFEPTKLYDYEPTFDKPRKPFSYIRILLRKNI